MAGDLYQGWKQASSLITGPVGFAQLAPRIFSHQCSDCGTEHRGRFLGTVGLILGLEDRTTERPKINGSIQRSVGWGRRGCL